MLADDLFGAVALDALGARIPRHAVARWVEEQDGMIADTSDQPFEMLLTLSQAAFGSLLAEGVRFSESACLQIP